MMVLMPLSWNVSKHIREEAHGKMEQLCMRLGFVKLIYTFRILLNNESERERERPVAA
jgi:hypothetical protein